MEISAGIFTFNFQSLIVFADQGIFQIVIQSMAIFGWLIFFGLFLFVGLEFYKEYRENIFTKDWEWTLLAIDVPQLNIQTPKAVELLFAHLAGAFGAPDIAAKFRGGFKQRWFSMEIISVEGYIQFLVWTEESFRDLVEAAVFAQYPDAEITEVEDYTEDLVDNFPDDDYDMWASDFTLLDDSAYQIRTYKEFEHNISKDTILKDPMGAFLESFSRIGPGEQMWFQIIIEPISNDWKEGVIKKIKEMIGDKSVGGKNFLDHTTQFSLKLLEGVGDQVFAREASESKDESREPPNKIQYLTPGQSKLLEAMEDKITKIGFKTKMRGVYLARKEVFKPQRGVNLLLGAVNQFNNPSANSLAPTYGVSASYFLKDWRINYRKNLLFKAYRKRKLKIGSNPFILNIEELATIWHFPMSHIKTPLLQKAQVKQAEPPIGLPIESVFAPEEEEESEEGDFKTDAGDFGYDDEIRFG